MRIVGVVMFGLALFSMTTSASGQHAIVIDGTSPAAGVGNTLGVGQIVRIHLKFQNLSDSAYVNTNAFRVYSPDGATWAPQSQVGNVILAAPNNTGVQVDSTGAISKAVADIVWHVRGLGCDGLGDDTITTAFVSMGNPFPIPPQFDARVLSFVVYTGGPENLGKHICVDSVTHFPVTNTWKWAQMSPPEGGYAYPVWNGPVCFELVSTGQPPVFTNLPAEITAEHCSGSVTYDFDASDPESDPIAFRLESGPGSIDEITGIWSASGLAPGNYAITVAAANGTSGGDMQTVPVIITNDPPVGNAPGGSYVAFAGYPTKRQVLVTDACDPMTVTFFDLTGPAGLVTLDSGNVVTFTPAVSDAGHTTVRLKVTDQYGAADTINLEYDVVVCGIRVGNIDCDLNDQVDIADLTRLIDFLFLTQQPLCSGMKSPGDTTAAETTRK